MVAEREAVEGVDLRRLGPADATRLLEIVLTFARHGAVVVVRRGPFLVARPRRRAPRAAAVAIRRSLADLGPTFVKFGQLAASSPGLFPATLSHECRRLLDDVPPVPTGAVRRVVEADFGRPVGELFAEFTDEPAASASIAQVHAARLADGAPVAVKVRRPRLERRIRQDLRLLRLCALALERAGGAAGVANPVAIVDDFAATLSGELDLRAEAAAMAQFARNLRTSAACDEVVVPVPVPGMVSRRVLVMSYVDGHPIDDVDRIREAGRDPEALLLVAVRAWMEGALVHGFFHGDVHAGNIFLTPEGRVAFLDFGIMGSLDESTRAAVSAGLPQVLLERDFRRAAEIVVRLGAAPAGVDMDGLAADVEAVVAPLLAARLADVRYGEILDAVIRAALRHGLRLPRELVLVAKQALYFERYAKELAPDHALLSDPRLLQGLAGMASR